MLDVTILSKKEWEELFSIQTDFPEKNLLYLIKVCLWVWVYQLKTNWDWSLKEIIQTAFSNSKMIIKTSKELKVDFSSVDALFIIKIKPVKIPDTVEQMFAK